MGKFSLLRQASVRCIVSAGISVTKFFTAQLISLGIGVSSVCCSIQRSKPKLRLYSLTQQTQPKTLIPMSHELNNTFRGDGCPQQG